MNRQILRLAIPNILSNLSVPLLGIADTALMGHLDDEVYLGAIALGGILFNFIFWGFAFLRMGTTGMTAQAFGRMDRREWSLILSRALIVAAAGSVWVILLQWPIAWLGFSLIQGEALTEQFAREYFFIRIWAAPASLALYAFHGWFLGMQNARYPMFLTIFVNVLNIGVSVLFIFGFGMKSAGVAWGTVIAQYAGLAIAIRLFYKTYKQEWRPLKRAEILHLKELRRFFSVNSDIFIRTILLVLSFAVFTSRSAAIDTLTLDANQILLQLFYVMSYGVDGFAFAAESLSGKFKGANMPEKLREAVRLLFIWGGGLGLVFALIFLIAGKPLLYIFTHNPEIIATAQPYILWLAVIALGGAIAFMWDGVYIGVTATRALRNTMLISTLFIFLPTLYLTFPTLGNHALWLAMALFMFSRAVFLTLLAKKQVFKAAA